MTPTISHTTGSSSLPRPPLPLSYEPTNPSWSELQKAQPIHLPPISLDTSIAKHVKRAQDIIISCVALTLLSPLLVIIAIKIKLSSAGPVIFKQRRYGLCGKIINIYKFRSMNCQEDGAIVKQATPKDPRITPFGAFLRKTSLDELPQFFNVLQGRISVVGPRPHAIAHNEKYKKLIPQYMERHLVKPGITGWAQVNGWRGETNTLKKMEQRVYHDLYYIKNWSFWLDIKIIFLTLLKGFSDKNAY